VVNTLEVLHVTARPSWRKVAWPLVTAVVVTAMALLVLLRDPYYYYTDDAAAQILPMWYSLGEHVRSGQWPMLLDVHSWMGGNLAIEALYGVWNPVYALLWVTISLIPNLFVAALLVRIVAFVLLALGCYGLAREYGAARWAASTMSVVLPVVGSLIYFDAAKWPAALVDFVWIPYVWWVARRASRGATNVWWAFLLGALAVTAGNPYAMLALCVVLLGLFIETALRRNWAGVGRLTALGVAVVCVAPLVYLPLVLGADDTWRTPQGIGYSGMLTPHTRDLINFSLPGYVPTIPGVGDAAVYFCWFALPLAPWLNWSVLRRRWRELFGGLFVAAVFALMARGPSELWMFRWPLRVLHYGYLGAVVVFAVLLSAGLCTNYLRTRIAVTVALAVVTGGTATVLHHRTPAALQRDWLSLALVAALTAAAFWAHHRGGRRWLGASLQAGTVIAFVVQLVWFFGYHGAAPYYFPTSVAKEQANYANRYRGEIIQIANTTIIGPPDQAREAWRDLMPGNLYRTAHVDSVNAYTGIGFRRFSNALCLSYSGLACANAYPALWKPEPGTTTQLADLLRLDTVVVQRKLIDSPQVPNGWQVTERTDRITVLQRQRPVPWLAGRLSWASPGVRVTANSTPDDQHENVDFTSGPRPGPGQLIFARLAWPGYHATVDNREVPVHATSSGLLEVDLPSGLTSGQVRISWEPPGVSLGLALAGSGVLLALATGVIQGIGRRRRRGSGPMLPGGAARLPAASQPITAIAASPNGHTQPEHPGHQVKPAGT
jgi:hypothetical protein